MHKLTLNDAAQSTPASQPVVDATKRVSNNQTSSKESVNVPSTVRSALSPRPITPMNKKPSKPVLIVALLVALVLGTGTGYGTYKLSAKTGLALPGSGEPIQQVPEGAIKVGDTFGSEQADDFPDSAQGYLESGGIEGEGSHRLVRPGGDSQTVYLTSSVTDLEKFVGMEVKVWGETFKGQKAGWLMDVGRIEVLNLEGEAPTEE